MKDGQFEGADFTRADIKDSDLSCADLSGATLTRTLMAGEVRLHDAILDRALLNDADLRGATGLTWWQLESAGTIEGATLPEYLLRQRHARLKDAGR